jgi:hypothetical protein
MFSTLLFGIQHSPQRKIMVVLAGVLIVIGILFIPFYGGAKGVFFGIVFIALGLATVAIVSRVFAARDVKVGTQEQLDLLAKGAYNREPGSTRPVRRKATPAADDADEGEDEWAARRRTGPTTRMSKAAADEPPAGDGT